jgi:hypothetical protein
MKMKQNFSDKIPIFSAIKNKNLDPEKSLGYLCKTALLNFPLSFPLPAPVHDEARVIVEWKRILNMS